MSKRLILCDCSGTQQLDAKAIERASGLGCSRIHTALCTTQIDAAGDAIAAGDALIACGQEVDRFRQLAEEMGLDTPLFVDLRDRAGWSREADRAGPKMAALAAHAVLEVPATKTIDIASAGTCLIIGAGETAFAAAGQLAQTLAVTVLQTDTTDLPMSRSYEVVRGRLRRATGTLGQFSLTLDALQTVQPGGRGAFQLTPPRDGAQTECDVILDLSGAAPLFSAPHKRDGYLRADPGNRGAVAKAILEASQHVGTFEKPLYLHFEEHLCAHSRAAQTGCTRCIDACPTAAIGPAGDHVAIDPLVCAGCGACAALCPSGAISYDAPPTDALISQIRVLSDTYHAAGGTAPRLLVHDEGHGTEMIALAARFGDGLPADVIPLSVPALTTMGHAEILAALAAGFAGVDLLLSPMSERAEATYQADLARALGGADRVRLLEPAEPDALCAALYGHALPAAVAAPVLTMGSRRQIARTAARALATDITAPLPLPEGAPYGAVLVKTDACTLCLSCVSLCPSGALLDNPDRPELRFQEDACLQCGICARACPEKAITLEPRMDLSDAALSQRVLNEEEPFCCVECGTPFGVKSTIEKIMDKLAGKHSMFADSAAGRLIQMCDDCRVRAQYHSRDTSLFAGERPRVRTTDDYYSDRKDH